MIKAKAALYELTFEENGNQVQLTAEHIVQKDDVEAGRNENAQQEDDKSKYLVLDRIHKNKTTIDFSHKSTRSSTGRKSKRRSSIVHPESNTVVRGSCAVCLEDFQVSDLVVWSETKACPHVYHKACLVQYFSRQTNEEKNPCPTCRQSFCTIVSPTEQSQVDGTEGGSDSAAEVALGSDDVAETEGDNNEQQDRTSVRRQSV